MTRYDYRILILCTGNSARSIMAEALLNRCGQRRFQAYSAGSRPTGKVNPFAIEMVQRLGYPADALRSKSWDEFAGVQAPEMDIVITVCDNAAGETCPVWPGNPIRAHWGFDDPAAVEGSDEDKRAAFERVFEQIAARVRRFAALPFDSLDRNALAQEIRVIGDA